MELLAIRALRFNEAQKIPFIIMNTIVYSETWGGGSNPHFAHGKMCVFPFFTMGKKVYGKRGK